MMTMNLFRADALAAEHAPLMRELVGDEGALRAAGDVLAGLQRLVAGLTPRAVLAGVVASNDADLAGTLHELHELAAGIGEAAAAQHTDAAHVTRVLRADGATRNALDGAASMRLRVAQGAVRDAFEALAGLNAASASEAEKLRAAGLSPGELDALLHARAEGAGQRRDKLQAQAAGWRAEAGVLAEFLGDPMRDRSRLGLLAGLLAAERVPAGDAGRLAVEARWRAAGPVALVA